VVAKSATWVIASHADQVTKLVRMGRPRAGISVVPPGVDLNLFHPDGPKASRRGCPRIVSVGRLLPGMGFDALIRALPGLHDIELVIVGDGCRSAAAVDSEVHRLRRLSATIGVADRLRIYGSLAREEIPEMLRSADVAVCAPGNESVEHMALAATACGVPLIAPATGALADLVVHDVTGWLVTPNRPAELAKAVNRLMRDPFLRQSFGAAGRDRTRARYSWDRVAEDHERIYERVCLVGYRRSALA
jgi:D-inositol-3-phosphate glycosyltransferase